mgnify:CR=1 FL=1
MVNACAHRDRDAAIRASIKMGFLTGWLAHASFQLLSVGVAAGDESKSMLEAHLNAGFVIGEPFATDGLLQTTVQQRHCIAWYRRAV